MSVTKKRSRGRDSGDTMKNFLTIMIPGIQQSIDIEFPDGKLPVCERCKKIYKTRELCRVRDAHTNIPWNTTYLCISFDDSCLTLNAMNDFCLIDEERMRCRFTSKMLDEPPLPFRAKNIHEGDIHTPICTPCKEKNYTRHHCREKQQHAQLPWVTFYVMLSATPVSDLDEQRRLRIRDQIRVVSSPDKSEHSDDIRKVAPSRSCLLTVNSSSSTIRWLEIDPCVPRTDFKPIPNFTGNHSLIANQWHSRNVPNISVASGPYSSISNIARPRCKFDQQYQLCNPVYQNWAQKAEYQRGHPMHSQGLPTTVPFYEYPVYFNSYPYQQAEYTMMNPYASNFGQYRLSSGNFNSMPREMSNFNNMPREMNNFDYHNRFPNCHNTTYSQGQISPGTYSNEHYSRNPSKQEDSVTPWSHGSITTHNGDHEGQTDSTDQRHADRQLRYESNSGHDPYSDNDGKVAYQYSQSGNEDQYSQSGNEDQYHRKY